MITSVYSLSRSEYSFVITEPEATNCFSINFQIYTKKKSTQLYKNSFEKKYLKNSLCLFSVQNSLFTYVLSCVSRCDEASSLLNKNT